MDYVDLPPDPADEIAFEIELANERLAKISEAHVGRMTKKRRPCSNRYATPAPCAVCETHFDDAYADWHTRLHITLLEEE